MKMDYKKMSYVSGIVIFFSMVVLLLAIIGLAEKRIFFTKDYVVYIKFADVIGLQDQSKVFMRGYRIGTTKEVKFKEDGVTVRVDVNKKYKIPIDSEIEINTITLLGEKAITIFPGTSDKYFKPGDQLIGQNKDIMVQMKHILGVLRRTIEQDELDMKLKVKQLAESIETFHSFLGKMDTQMDQVDVEAYNQQITNLSEAGEAVEDFLAESSDRLQVSTEKFDKAMQDISVLSTQVSVLSTEVQEIATKINKGEGSAGEFINNKEYIENLNKTIKEFSVLIEDIKKNPKKYVNISIF
jgi:phospholipid/cholesterol/gamma-HCH transport system substrate-binding protein